MNMKAASIIMVTGLLILAGCQNSQPQLSMELNYHNPLWEGYLADPQVMCYQGEYYAIGTGKGPDGRQFPLLHSKDFTHWSCLGGALDTAGLDFKDYWAPEIVEHKGKFYLYYAGDCKMRVAVADKPAGPYKDAGVLLFPDEPFSIDGHPFFDPVSKQWYLFFARDFFDQRPGTALAVVRLADTMTAVEGPVTTVLRAFGDWQIYERNRTLYDRKWDAWHTVEGPFVIYREGRYYCFYSGGNWQTPGYGVGCAVADSVLGLYQDNWSKDKAGVLSTIPDKLIGPGHNSVIMGPDKQTWFIVYHSWNASRTARQICMDPLIWTNEGPKCFMPARGDKKVQLPVKSIE